MRTMSRRDSTLWAPALWALCVCAPAFAQEPPPPPATEEKKADEPPKAEEPPKADDEPVDTDDAADDGSDDGWGDEEQEPVFPRLEHRGYFRFRAMMFSNTWLGTQFRLSPTDKTTKGTSGAKPPLTENQTNNSGTPFTAEDVGNGNDESVVADANMRFRYQPTFLISPSLKIAGTFDVLDNLVLGSTPDFNFAERPDAPLSAFSTAQAPPGEGFQFDESIRVKELYGEWKLLGIPIRFGRMASNWGLGILANGGNGVDDDFGDYVDRVMAALQVYGVYIAGGYDIVSSGATYKQDFQPFGQAYDLTESDDVQQGFLAIFSRPIQEEEIAARTKRLVTERKPAFDWGVYTVYRKQNLDLSVDDAQKLATGEKTVAANFDELQLVKREAWAVIPDLWLRFEYRPSYSLKIHAELEAAMIVGHIGSVSPVAPQPGEDPARDLFQWGVALQSDITTGGLTAGLDAGIASGDDAQFLGVLDQKNFADGSTPNKDLENFKFDRNYHVDRILFREVIGTVTNAWYAKPYVKYDLFDSPDGAIGGRLDIELAGAMEKNAYPGKAAFLGTEVDATLFVEDEGKFYGDLTFGVLFPGEAFALKAPFLGYAGDTKDPEIAWTLQSHLILKY